MAKLVIALENISESSDNDVHVQTRQFFGAMAKKISSKYSKSACLESVTQKIQLHFLLCRPWLPL